MKNVITSPYFDCMFLTVDFFCVMTATTPGLHSFDTRLRSETAICCGLWPRLQRGPLMRRGGGFRPSYARRYSFNIPSAQPYKFSFHLDSDQARLKRFFFSLAGATVTATPRQPGACGRRSQKRIPVIIWKQPVHLPPPPVAVSLILQRASFRSAKLGRW